MKISITCDQFYWNDKLFSESLPENRDDCLMPFRDLRDYFSSRGHFIHTEDIISPLDADIVIDVDPPSTRHIDARRGMSVLFAFESPIIRPGNYIESTTSRYWLVFSWNKSNNQNNTYQIPIPIVPRYPEKKIPNNRSKFACLIAGNKTSENQKELYSERINVIRWFEKNAPQDFDLYGIGWDEGEDALPRLFRRGRVKRLLPKRIRFRGFPSFRGPVDSKSYIYSQYKYAFSYENCKDFPDYVTEKIFDPMYCGCIPIYKGAPNIEEYVPSNCFIDGNDFSSIRDLYSFLTKCDLNCIETYRRNIQVFLDSEWFKKLHSKNFAQRLGQVILNSFTSYIRSAEL